ncbi:CPBP family intramembrane glutamic endopeptidase [Pseudomonas sp. SDO528_S397]
MLALPWFYLILLSIGYAMALTYGKLGLLAGVSIALLLVAGFAVRQQRTAWARYIGHGLFIVLALGLAMHWLPGFYNGRVIDPQRLTDDAVPFSMYLNQDKSLIGFWLLLVCPWVVARRSLRLTICAASIALTLTAIAALGGALLLGIIHWAPKWPEPSWLWVLNNLLLVTLVEEALFRGYIQGGLSQRFKQLPYGEHLALLLAALLFGLSHLGAGWQWTLLATIAGVGYGLAYRFGGLGAAVVTHFGLNLLHFGLFTYPMLAVV